MERAPRELRAKGRRPFVIPLGASTPLGAAAFALAVGELLAQIPAPDAIVLSTSSGGTQAGLIAGCRLHGLADPGHRHQRRRSVGAIAAEIRRHPRADSKRCSRCPPARSPTAPIEVDDRFVGEGYGIPTPQSTEAIELCAQARGAVPRSDLYRRRRWPDSSRARARASSATGTVLFWHTGGQVGLFADR